MCSTVTCSTVVTNVTSRTRDNVCRVLWAKSRRVESGGRWRRRARTRLLCEAPRGDFAPGGPAARVRLGARGHGGSLGPIQAFRDHTHARTHARTHAQTRMRARAREHARRPAHTRRLGLSTTIRRGTRVVTDTVIWRVLAESGLSWGLRHTHSAAHTLCGAHGSDGTSASASTRLHWL
jgi:hypothetical protein